jgi:hypothetical protein
MYIIINNRDFQSKNSLIFLLSWRFNRADYTTPAQKNKAICERLPFASFFDRLRQTGSFAIAF